MFVVAWILKRDREENNDDKDGRSVREVESRMNYANHKYVLIGLQTLQRFWSVFVEALILMFELSGLMFCTSGVILVGAHICASQMTSRFFAISGLGNNRELKQTSTCVLTAGVCWSKYVLSVIASCEYLTSLSMCLISPVVSMIVELTNGVFNAMTTQLLNN